MAKLLVDIDSVLLTDQPDEQFMHVELRMGIRETSLIRHSMGHGNNVGLGGCWIMECLLPYLCMVTVPHIMVGLERMLDYRGVGLARFHCNIIVYCDIAALLCVYYRLGGVR